MAKKLYEESKIQAIADTIREHLPEDFAAVTYTTAEMPDGVVEACSYQAGVGFEDGCKEGRHECAQKHFVHNFVGDGSGSYSFRVPFEPDVVQIIGYAPALENTANTLFSVMYDRRAFGLVAGFTLYGNGRGSCAQMAYTVTGALSRYSRTEDGTITVQNIGGTTAAIVYAKGAAYTAIALKYTEQTDKERITEFVNGLTGSGKATLYQAKVNAAVTDDEWAALIATKPDWTFSWI